METIKQHFLSRFNTYLLLSISIGLSLFLLMVRIKLAQSAYFLFLVWNLSLGLIPFAITSYLISRPKLHKFMLLIGFLAWLLFLPNAPYLITDFAHLKYQTNLHFWLDILLISTFALNGMLLFYLSVLDMKVLLQPYIKNSYLNGLIQIIFVLSGFGIYLGRYLRYNSWEILQTPVVLFNDIFNIALHPLQHIDAWLFTLIFGLFLSTGYWMFNMMGNKS